MNSLKRLAIFIVSTLVFLFAFQWLLDEFGFRSIFFAFLVNWLVMSWVAVLGQAISFSLPDAYYEIKPFENGGRIYERLGIRLFKKLVRRGPLTLFSPTLRRKADGSLHELEPEMKKAEAGHVIIFVLMLIFVGYAGIRGWFDAVGWLMLFNLAINGYPVMLQRYNRIKLHQKTS